MSGRVSNATGRPRRKLRFSLKALMVGIALCASPMGGKDMHCKPSPFGPDNLHMRI